MSDGNFWEERAGKIGHTGWSDVKIYAFDQKIRLDTVDYMIRTYGSDAKGTLLDFGCGTGDFARKQKKKFNQVVIYDTCESVLDKAIKRIPECIAYSNMSDLEKDHHVQDVILSITVLQHILDDHELKKIVRLIQEKLSDEGVFIVMEGFGNRGGQVLIADHLITIILCNLWKNVV